MKLLEILKRAFLTRICLICKEAISYDEDEPFCEECIEKWNAFLKAKCHVCGYDRNGCTCLPSQVKQINDSLAAWCVFYDPRESQKINEIIFKLKKNYNREIINMCAKRMAKAIISLCVVHKIDYKKYIITYTPRRMHNFLKYGFDHSGKLAKAIGEILGLKVEKTIKNIGKKEQKKLNKNDRKLNAQKSYEIRKNFDGNGKNYFLIDDIMTTGSTLYACAKLLYENGAKNVIPVTFAKDNKQFIRRNKNVKRHTGNNIARVIKSFMRNGSQ
ncbi:MAG: ComF family protein [Clostridia bacterium]|nr:ComF family protein [Clostridia bacterium]